MKLSGTGQLLASLLLLVSLCCQVILRAPEQPVNGICAILTFALGISLVITRIKTSGVAKYGSIVPMTLCMLCLAIEVIATLRSLGDPYPVAPLFERLFFSQIAFVFYIVSEIVYAVISTGRRLVEDL